MDEVHYSNLKCPPCILIKVFETCSLVILSLFGQVKENKNVPSKRVNIVSIRLVRESSLLYQNRSIRSPKDGYELFKQYLGDVDREHFVVACLDTKNQPTSIQTVAIGNLNSAIVSTREVFKCAILSNSASILVGHNHPSGNSTPSNEDCEVTKRLVEAGKLLGIEVLDHIVLGDNNFVSLKEKGIV
jgi:DNA repair protein RadC